MSRFRLIAMCIAGAVILSITQLPLAATLQPDNVCVVSDIVQPLSLK